MECATADFSQFSSTSVKRVFWIAGWLLAIKPFT